MADLTRLIPVKKYSISAYKQMLLNLLPTGQIWRNLGDNFKLLLEAFACELDRIDQRLVDLTKESVPGLSNELLPEWEAAALLPSELPGAADTLLQRQLTVHAKITQQMDYASEEFFIAYAAALGMVITITDAPTATPFEVGTSTMGTPLAPSTTRFYWVVNVTSDPNSNINKLITAFRRLKPAHTAFFYNGTEYQQ